MNEMNSQDPRECVLRRPGHDRPGIGRERESCANRIQPTHLGYEFDPRIPCGGANGDLKETSSIVRAVQRTGRQSQLFGEPLTSGYAPYPHTPDSFM